MSDAVPLTQDGALVGSNNLVHHVWEQECKTLTS
jgi:hypothetical protein